MAGENLPVAGRKSFEDLKQHNPYGAEYWTARDLQPHLGYDQWRRFENAIKKAMVSCEQSGNDPGHHFAGADKMVTLGSGSQRKVNDYHLSRFACYLNGRRRRTMTTRIQRAWALVVSAALAFPWAAAGCSGYGSEPAAPAGARPAPPAPARGSAAQAAQHRRIVGGDLDVGPAHPNCGCIRHGVAPLLRTAPSNERASA